MKGVQHDRCRIDNKFMINGVPLHYNKHMFVDNDTPASLGTFGKQNPVTPPLTRGQSHYSAHNGVVFQWLKALFTVHMKSFVAPHAINSCG